MNWGKSRKNQLVISKMCCCLTLGQNAPHMMAPQPGVNAQPQAQPMQPAYGAVPGNYFRFSLLHHITINKNTHGSLASLTSLSENMELSTAFSPSICML